MERIGIYTGTFNPVHTGHIQAALQAAASLRLDRVLLIPDCETPHKQMPEGSATPRQRLDMLNAAVCDHPQLEVSDAALRRGGVTFTWQTLLDLREIYPNAEFVLLMGSDMFLKFGKWIHTDVILRESSLGVLYRGDRGEIRGVQEKIEELQELDPRIEIAENKAVCISSSDLRRMLVFRCAAPFLPKAVMDYIDKNKLYGVEKPLKNLPMDHLEKAVIHLLKPGRVAHVLGCRDTAVALAKHWGADVTDAARAGVLHDITKALDGPLQLTLCSEYGTILSDFSRKYPKTLHALTGSLVADRIFGENRAVTEAVRHHTTGKGNMNLLEKIIYVADYMEPNRDIPGVEQLRLLAFSDIDAALKLGLEMTLEHLNRQGAEVSPESKEALEYLNHQFEKQPC